MAFVIANRVRETTTTAGTGTITLAGAVLGYQSFTAIGNANTTFYTIASRAVTEWEVGIGTYTASGTTLARTTVLASSNGGSLVNFSAGEKDVFCDYPSEKAVYQDGNATLGTVTSNTLTGSSSSATGTVYGSITTGVVNFATGLTTGTLNIHTGQSTGALTVGGSGATGTINIGRSTVSQTLNFGYGATASGSTKTINFGTAGVSGSTTLLNLGSAVAGSTTTINAYGTWDFKNSALNGVGNLVFNDPGPGEGLEWAGGNGWKIYEAPNDLSNAAGNIQFVTGSTRLGTLDTTGWFEAIGGVEAPEFLLTDSGDYITNTLGLESWTYSANYSVVAQSSEPRGISFSGDGTKMYIVSNNGTFTDAVVQYTLATAWDATTATYLQAFSVTAQAVNPTDLYFKPDGTSFYVVDDTTDAVYRYNLGTAWDISTSVYANSFSVAAQEASVTGITFSLDGTKMYVGGTSGDDVNQYNLGTAWDITTAVYSTVFSVATYSAGQDGFCFNATGTTFWLVDSGFGRVIQYDLGTPWEISTSVFVNYISLYTAGNYLVSGLSGIFVNELQNKAWFSDYTNDRIFQYTTNLNATKFVGSKYYFYPDTQFRSDLTVYGNERVDGTLVVGNNTTVSGTLTTNTIGSTSSSTTGTVYATIGSGTVNIATGLSTGTLNIHTSQTTGALTIGGTGSTGAINIGRSTAAQTINIGYGATATATTKTLNLGTAGVSGSTTNINYGSAVSGATSNHTFYGGVGIGSTALAGYTLNGGKDITGATTGYGVVISGDVQSDVTVFAQYFRTTAKTAAAAFTLPQLNHFTADQGTFGAGSTVTTQIGYAANSSLTGATSNYGFYGNIASGTGRWNFYAAGTADNYFAGNVGIGATGPDYRLDVTATDNVTTTIAMSVQNSSRNYGLGIGAYIMSNRNIGGTATTVDYTFDIGGAAIFKTSNAERIRIDSAGNSQFLSGSIVEWAPAPAAISTTATLTNANIQGQIINTTGTTYTVTMPLGTTMETLVPWAAVNLGYDFYVVNTASGTITMAVNTGVTAVGSLTVATGVSAQFRIRRTAANTFIMYRLG